VLRVISPEWRTWLERAAGQGGRARGLENLALQRGVFQSKNWHSMTRTAEGFLQAKGRVRWRATRFRCSSDEGPPYGEVNQMTDSNPKLGLGMLIIRRIICVISWGFVFPRAFTEHTEEKPASEP
jgi:hypothetical protein